MQNAKDSFYVALRDRLAQVNPARVVTVRALQRPGIVVEDAEAPQAELLENVFVLRWRGVKRDTQLPSILTQMTCEIAYATGGSQPMAGLDRGRMLAAMTKELAAMLCPSRTQKMSYAVTPPVAMQTLVFWSDPVFSDTVATRYLLSQTAVVTVFAFEEQGES